MILEKINKPNDIKALDPIEYNQLADEIRQFLIENISKTGGHLASNLGVVELTMALHLVFNLPQDKLIWDVGHQAYTHKILTGRKNQFDQLRKFGGMSGFPKRNESHYDAFHCALHLIRDTVRLQFQRDWDMSAPAISKKSITA